jgi:uroporphyrinogen decarboxylase
MTSRERVRKALERKPSDRVPANFECVGTVMENLMRRYGYSDPELVLERFEIDIRPVGPAYIGPPLRTYEQDGERIEVDYWGTHRKNVWTGKEFHGAVVRYPLDGFETIGELEAWNWPSPDWFDYEGVKRQCDAHGDRALVIGHEGPFQVACFFRSMEKLFTDMALEPEFARRLFDRMVGFELEYYERTLIAGEGRIDILRTHDDYGTQIGMLFGLPMWRDFFKENTRRLVNLAHRYGAFFQQHSCGAIAPVIPELIECGVDSLEPIQKVAGMETEVLKRLYGDRIAFHGGVDTQSVLPFGTVGEVERETRRVIETLGKGGGYILMASQGFEGDVPLENIEALYRARDAR